MFAAAMRLLLRCLRLGRRRRCTLVWQAEQLWRYGHLCLRSLLYNSFTNGDVVLDSLFEPVYWLVDHVTRWFGVVSTFAGDWGECDAGATEPQGCLCLRQEGSGTSACCSDWFPVAASCPCLSPWQQGTDTVHCSDNRPHSHRCLWHW